jgi:ABC-2 type transport system permease protein
MWNICKKEISQFFSSLTGYIAVILFLLINGMFLFLLQDSNIFDFGYENFTGVSSGFDDSFGSQIT